MTSGIPEGFPITVPKGALVGLDGLDEIEEVDPNHSAPDERSPLRLATEAAERIRTEIERAGGREVCFLAEVDGERVIRAPRAVSRGNFEAVLVAARDAPDGGIMIHNHPNGVMEPSGADMNVAAHLYEQGLGTAIVDNLARQLYVVVEPPAPRSVTALDTSDVDDVLGPDGALAQRWPAYEDRPGQREMAALVLDQYNEGGIAFIEAGTGTGKSLAYLLPAVRWAQVNDERTVISTNTINLQEQLAHKDLPLVQSLVGEVSWALVKGRGNYVSIRRALLAAESQGTLFEEDRSEELRGLLEWINTTDDGSLSDLSLSPAEETWDEVKSDPDMCLRARCPHFQQCFYQESRRRAAAAKVLIVNHHLLFTDLAVRRATRNYTQAAVLPAYKRVVLDEAHNVEDAATSHLGVQVTRRGLYRALSRLDRRGRGILTAVHEALGPVEGGAELRERIENRVRPALSRVRATLDGLLERIEPLARAGEGAKRLGGQDDFEPAADPDVSERLGGAVTTMGRLERELGELRARLEVRDEVPDQLQARILDLRAIERRLGASAHALRLVLAPGDDADAFVRWMESRGRGRRTNLLLGAAPIELGPVLRESLFGPTDTAVLTSATLTTRRSFHFLRDRLGVAVGEVDAEGRAVGVEERSVPSPFAFDEQALLSVVTDLPPARAGAAFDDATAGVVRSLAEVTDGGLFTLFTSYSALRRVAEQLRGRGVERRWPLMVQGEEERHHLLTRFVEAGNGILLGTSSFWEGVDVPGDPLRGLVIQKLPFRVPTEPITAARMEALEQRGIDPFQNFMLPHAALRLKQGFGRLIRSRTDRGAVVLLDDRILRKRYGRYLVSSLPSVPLVKGSWADIERRLEEFYGR